MTAPNQSDTATPRGAIRAGECPYCDALFLVPGSEERSVLCPACDKEVDSKAARVRSLLMAMPVPPQPESSTPEPPPSAILAPAPEEPEPIQEESSQASDSTTDFDHEPSHPTDTPAVESPITASPVAEEPLIEAPVAEAPEPPSEPQPLSDLGTLLGMSDLAASGVHVNEPPGQSPVEPAPTEEPAKAPLEDPRPLSDALGLTSPEPEQAEIDSDSQDESDIPGGATIDYSGDLTLGSPSYDLEYTEDDTAEDPPAVKTEDERAAFDLEAADEAGSREPESFESESLEDNDGEIELEGLAQETPILNRSRDSEEQEVVWAPPLVDESATRKWLAPLLATAGLLIIGAPLGYVVWKSSNATPTASALDNAGPTREARDELLEGADEVTTDDDGFLSEPDEDKVVAASASLSEDSGAGVETAAYESPDSIYGDRYADQASAEEPVSLSPYSEEEADPLAEFETSGTSIGGENALVGAPLYDVETLVEATELAAAAGPAFTAGTLDTDEDVAEMGQHYARLCYLAQVLTLLDTGSFDLSLTTVQLEATDVFRKIFQDSDARSDSKQIASHWIAWEGRPHGGVFFTGTPDDAGRNGDVFEYRFPLADGQRIYVLTEEKIDPKRFALAGAKEIGVIGVVVEDPASRVRGYKGDQSRVVWARKTIPLREAKN